MTPEDVGVSYQVRYCSGAKRILDWFWKVKKKDYNLFAVFFSYSSFQFGWSHSASSDEVQSSSAAVQWVNNAIQQISDIIIKFGYNVCCHRLKEHALSEYRACWRHCCSLWKESLFWKLKVMCGPFNRFFIVKQTENPWLCSVLFVHSLQQKKAVTASLFVKQKVFPNCWVCTQAKWPPSSSIFWIPKVTRSTYHYSTLNGMLIHLKMSSPPPPPRISSGFPDNSTEPFYTPGWREALQEESSLPKNTTHEPGQVWNPDP